MKSNWRVLSPDWQTSMEHHVVGLRLANFMGFHDSGWIPLVPLTLLYGSNSSGKSAIIRALVLLKSSHLQPDPDGTLKPPLEYGHFENIVRNHATAQDIEFGLRCAWVQSRQEVLDDGGRLHHVNINPWRSHMGWLAKMEIAGDTLDLYLRYGLANKEILLKGVQIRADMVHSGTLAKDVVLFSATRTAEAIWTIAHDGMDVHLVSDTSVDDDKQDDYLSEKGPELEDPWPSASIYTDKGIVPGLYIPNATRTSEWKRNSYFWARDLLELFQTEVAALLGGLTYLGPLRDTPRRYYHVPWSPIHDNSNSAGNYLRAIADPDKSASIVGKYSSALGRLGKRYALKPMQLNSRESLYSIELADSERSSLGEGGQDNMRDVGFGVSQSMPLIVGSLVSSRAATIVIEQPEVHLHPEAQVALMDFFIDQTAEESNSNTFIIETHSENLLLRIQRRIAESTYRNLANKYLNLDATHELSNEDLAIVYVRRNPANGCSEIEYIRVNDSGYLIDPSEEFEEFFRFDFEDVNAHVVASDAIRRWRTHSK